MKKLPLAFALTLLFVSACSNPPRIPAEEYAALTAFYASTGGPNWLDNRGWLSDAPPCEWYGIICEGGHVVSLTLNVNDMEGGLPPEIGDLSHLHTLVMYFNAIGGPLPPRIGAA